MGSSEVAELFREGVEKERARTLELLGTIIREVESARWINSARINMDNGTVLRDDIGHTITRPSGDVTISLTIRLAQRV